MLTDIISYSPKNIQNFHLFSTSHIVAVIVIITFSIMSITLLKRPKLSKYRKPFRYTMFIIIIAEELLFKIWRIFVAHTSIADNLSLHLCGVAIILLAIVLINKNERIYEITYFWGLAGATQAILTPDLGQYGFPHFRYFQFFLSHGLIVAVVVYLLVVEGLKPKIGSLKRVFIITNVYALFVGIINYLLDTNYLFIAHKPETASVLDFLGPWPWYIISLEVIALILFTIVYLPFLIPNWLNTIRRNKSTFSE